MLARLNKRTGAWEPWNGVNEEFVYPYDKTMRVPITASVVDQYWSDAELGDYGLKRVQQAEVPEGKRVTSRTYAPVDGKVQEVVVLEDIPIPAPRTVAEKLADIGLTVEELKEAMK